MASAPTLEVKPSTLNISVRKGSTLRRTITWYSRPAWLDARETELDTENSIPVDLTGYTARMQVRDRDTRQLVFELTTENGGLVLGGTAGTVSFFLSDTDTDNPASDRCLYDLELVSGTGDVVPLLAGSFVLPDQVTV